MYKKIIKILKENDIPYIVYTHCSVYNSAQVLTKLSTDKNFETKSLALSIKHDVCVVTLPILEKFNSSLAEKIAAVKKFSFLNEAAVESILGVKIGAISPFGYTSKVRCFISTKILNEEYLYFSPARHDITFKIKSKDLKILSEKGIFQFITS